MDERIAHHLRELEILVRDADEAILNARTPLMRKRATKQRNAINAACNALYRGYRA